MKKIIAFLLILISQIIFFWVGRDTYLDKFNKCNFSCDSYYNNWQQHGQYLTVIMIICLVISYILFFVFIKRFRNIFYLTIFWLFADFWLHFFFVTLTFPWIVVYVASFITGYLLLYNPSSLRSARNLPMRHKDVKRLLLLLIIFEITLMITEIYIRFKYYTVFSRRFYTWSGTTDWIDIFTGGPIKALKLNIILILSNLINILLIFLILLLLFSIFYLNKRKKTSLKIVKIATIIWALHFVFGLWRLYKIGISDILSREIKQLILDGTVFYINVYLLDFIITYIFIFTFFQIIALDLHWEKFFLTKFAIPQKTQNEKEYRQNNQKI